MASTRKQWGDFKEHDDGGDADSKDVKDNLSLSSEFRSKPDAQGVTTITSEEKKDGQRIRVTRKVKITTKPVRVLKSVLARRKLPKFGDCKGLPPGPESNVTYISQHELIDLSDLRMKRKDESKEVEEGEQSLKPRESSIVQCRTCGEKGHWTRHCPNQAKAAKAGAPGSGKEAPKAGSGAPAKQGAYQAPHLREGAKRSERGVTMLRDDSAALRVTNLSEETKESDLMDLFRPFGHVTRVFLAKDKKTFESRGFAFVNFADKRSAQEAINKLNGYGYDNLILRVEWAKPREEREGAAEKS